MVFTSRQIRPTTSAGESGSPKTSIVLSPPGLADDIALGAQSLAQGAHGGTDIFAAAIDAADGKHEIKEEG